MTFEEGASFTSNYATGIHGLYELANLKQGEKILIHAGAGGVGMRIIYTCL